MQKYICTLLPAYLLLFSSLYGMNYEDPLENKIIVQNNLTQPNNLPVSIKNDTNSSSNMVWQYKSPYSDSDCNDCRCTTASISSGIGGGCTIVKGLDAICTSCANTDYTCGDVCSDIWLPVGRGNCHYAGNVCHSTCRWAVTLSLMASLGIAICSYNPCCTEKGPYCCLKKTPVENTLISRTIEMGNDN